VTMRHSVCIISTYELNGLLLSGVSWWLGGRVVRVTIYRVSDLQLNGHEFDPRPPHYQPVGTGMGGRLRAGIVHTTSECNQPPG